MNLSPEEIEKKAFTPTWVGLNALGSGIGAFSVFASESEANWIRQIHLLLLIKLVGVSPFFINSFKLL